jgi:DNA adenine methylase
MKTFTKWLGNKSQHLRHILPLVPEFTGTYIEPFVGSGALLLKLEPEKWIINDLNRDLINVWKTVRDNPDEIIDEFKKFGLSFKPMSKEDKTSTCKKITSSIDTMEYNTERAIKYLLMKYCVFMGNLIVRGKLVFNGIDMNVNRGTYPFLKETYYIKITKASEFLRDGEIYNKDYKEILQKAKRGDFVFLDPPYIEEHDYQFNYNKGEVLDQKFLDELVNQVKILDSNGVKWLMTQADTTQVRDAFKAYTITYYDAYRQGRKEYIKELLVRNY